MFIRTDAVASDQELEAPMFLSRLVYFSHPVPLGNADVTDILTKSYANNYLENLTGALFYNGSWFVQVLEGARDIVTQMFLKISADPRHTGVTLMEFGTAQQRLFAEWEMRYIGAGPLQEAIIRKYMPAGFDPTVIAESAAMVRLLRELADATPPDPSPRS
nr:BLUF domain-containing protein [Azospirillum soli]